MEKCGRKFIMTDIHTLQDLEDRLSEPTPGLLDTLRRLPGDLLVLGVGGKMGPTLARMARRAFDQLGRRDRVFGVARFSAGNLAARLRRNGVETMTCDLLDREMVRQLPEAPHVIFMAGQKFGASQGPDLIWAMNTLAPALVAEKFARSRMVVFSTGCVYPLAPIDGGGASEESDLGPPGDYANSCVGRERIFTYFSNRNRTPLAIYRLNYAIDLRYGVLLDLAQKVWRGEPVDVTMGHVNIIWQRDANAQAIQCLAHATHPPFLLNVTGAETLSVRSLAQRLGERLGRTPRIVGQEAPTAWLSNSAKARKLFGPPTVDVEQMMDWTARWVKQGGATLEKPTHFEVRDGKF